MKNIAIAAAIAVAAATAAHAGTIAEPIIEPEIIVQDSSSSAAHVLIPLAMLVVLAAVALN